MSIISDIIQDKSLAFDDKTMKCHKEHIIWWMLGFVVAMYLLNLSLIFFVDDKDLRGTFGD